MRWPEMAIPLSLVMAWSCLRSCAAMRLYESLLLSGTFRMMWNSIVARWTPPWNRATPTSFVSMPASPWPIGGRCHSPRYSLASFLFMSYAG